MKKADFKNLVTLCRELNFMGKRKRDTRLEVVEQAISELGLNADAGVIMPKVFDTLEAEKVKLKKARKTVSDKPAADTMVGTEQKHADSIPVLEGDAFLITSAQNNTEVMPHVFAALKRVSGHFNARLVALPSYYNKNAFSATVESESERFKPELHEYLIDNDCWLFGRGNVRLCPEAAILPTAKLPINAAALLNSGELRTIVSHPAQQMRTLPSLAQHQIKRAWSTGSCTAFNYVRGRAGSEAEKNHVFGGILVYQVNGHLYETNVRVAENGSVSLYTEQGGIYSTDTTTDCAIKLGDLHCEVYDDYQWKKALDIVSDLNPMFTAVDDILHFSTRSHHNRNNSKHLYQTRHESVEGDIKQVVKQLNMLSQFSDVYVTESNHNSALDCWLEDSGLKIDFDSHNAKLYHLLKWLVYDTLDNGKTDSNALEVALRNSDFTGIQSLPDNVTFGRMDRAQIFARHDFSQHGHKGQNGAAGNPNQLKGWNLPLVTGHTHSPNIIGNVFTTGVTARLNQGYNRGGASSWDHGHVIEWGNGECQMVLTNPQKLVA